MGRLGEIWAETWYLSLTVSFMVFCGRFLWFFYSYGSVFVIMLVQCYCSWFSDFGVLDLLLWVFWDFRAGSLRSVLLVRVVGSLCSDLVSLCCWVFVGLIWHLCYWVFCAALFRLLLLFCVVCEKSFWQLVWSVVVGTSEILLFWSSGTTMEDDMDVTQNLQVSFEEVSLGASSRVDISHTCANTHYSDTGAVRSSGEKSDG